MISSKISLAEAIPLLEKGCVLSFISSRNSRRQLLFLVDKTMFTVSPSGVFLLSCIACDELFKEYEFAMPCEVIQLLNSRDHKLVELFLRERGCSSSQGDVRIYMKEYKIDNS